MIVPILTGSGMRMKILEAAAMSLPFVTTSIGVEGLNFKDHESCLIADTPEDFAQSIIKLSMDAKLRKSLAERANLIFKNQYSKKVLADVRDDTYLKILQL
jgi:glycosyltransferase involved in cell wall biosynthesis